MSASWSVRHADVRTSRRTCGRARARTAGGVPRRHRAYRWTTAAASSPTPTCSWSASGSRPSVPRLPVPEGTLEIDASGGIVMPGMIDTHRHMWQTAMRGLRRRLDPHAVLRLVLPGARQGVPARRTSTPATCWPASSRWTPASPPPSTGRTGCRPPSTPTPRWTRCRRCRAASCWRTATSRPARGSGRRRRSSGTSSRRRITPGDDMLGFQMAFDVTGDPAFPEKAAFEVARDLGVPVTTHAGVWGATNDDGIRLMHENGFADPGTIYVHAATLSDDSYQRIAATGGSVSVSTESEQSCGQGYPPTWALRSYDIPVSLSMDTSVWWSGDLFSAMRTHARRGPLPRAPRGARQGRHGHQLPPARRPGRRVGHPRRRQGARTGRRRRQPRAGQEGRRRADQERPVAGDVPAAQPVRARGLPGPARRRPHGRSSTAGS